MSSLVLLSRPWKCGLAACVALILLEAALLAVIRPNDSKLVKLHLQESFGSYDAAGFHRRQFFDEGRNAHAYTVFVPHRTETTARPPVILFLNGSRCNSIGRPTFCDDEQRCRYRDHGGEFKALVNVEDSQSADSTTLDCASAQHFT